MKKTDNSFKKNIKTKSHPFWSWFWLSFLVISLAYAWYSFYAPSNNVKWVDNIKTTQNLTNDSGKNTLVFFTGKWCSPCQIMKREVFADQEVAKLINTQVIPVIIDIDNPETKTLVKHYKVGATPTTIIVDAEGKVLDYAVGKIEKKKFLKLLDNLKSE